MDLRILTLLAAIFIFWPLSSNAKYAPSIKWNTIETPHFLIHYHTGLEDAASEVANQAEEIQLEVSSYFNWTPKSRTHVVLSDQSETPNGNASVFPNNRIELFMAPPSDVSGLEDYQNWKRLVLKHEYVHIVHLDKAEDFPLDVRSILGRHWLFFPNTFLPRWMTEGIATFIETEDKNKIGRGQSNFFRGMMRNEVINGIKSLNQINQYRTEWPTGTGFYLYGVYFFNFIRDTYGEDKIKMFVSEYSYFPVPYFINTVSKKTFGKDMFALWGEFEVYLAKEFEPEIETHRKQRIESDFKQITTVTSSGYYSGFSRIQDNKLYFVRTNQENIKELVEQDLNTKETQVVSLIRKQDYIFPQSFDVNSQGILIPLLEMYENTRQSFDLYNINPVTGARTQITQNKRYIRAIWAPDGNNIIALGNHNGLHNLDLLDTSGKFIKTIWRGKPGFAVNTFDRSPVENKLVVSLFSPDKGWNLHILNLDTGDWAGLTNNASIEAYPHFSDSGSQIIYSADYDGIYNSYQLTIDTGDIVKLTDSLTVTLFPTLDERNKLIYFTELDKNGFNLKQAKPLEININKELVEGNNNQFIAAPSVNNSQLASDKTPYAGVKYLSPPWWLPVYVSDQNQSSLGFETNTSDPLNFHTYRMLLLYDTKNLQFNWNVNYLNTKHDINFIINSRREAFNSVYLNERETESIVALIYPYIRRDREWNLFSSFQRLTTELSIPNTQLKASETDYHSTIGLSYDSTSENSRSVSAHDGIKSSVSYELNKVETTVQQHSRVTLDIAVFSPHFYHNVFEARATYIGAGGNANTIYLGGTQDNYISPIPFGRNNYSLKGYAVNQFSGTNLQKIALQLHSPVFYPETGIMRPPVGVGRINIHTLFESGRVGSFNGINSQKWFSSIALEINLQANFGYGRWPFDITTGLARGLNTGGKEQLYMRVNLNF